MTPLRRRSFVLLALAAALLACGPPQRVYSLDPVDTEGNPLPFSKALAIHFEDGEELRLSGSQRIVIEGDRLGLGDGQSWPLSAIGSIDWDDDGEIRQVQLLTPEDLLDFEDLPRLERIELRDGRIIEMESRGVVSRWSADQLAIEISEDGEDFEALRLDELRSVELHPTNLADATILSWKFYVVAGATVALIWVIGNPDRDGLAVK